jgi:hypothetical protein
MYVAYWIFVKKDKNSKDKLKITILLNLERIVDMDFKQEAHGPHRSPE